MFAVIAYVSFLTEDSLSVFFSFPFVYINTDRLESLLGRTGRSRFLLELFNKQVPLQNLFVECFKLKQQFQLKTYFSFSV